MKKLIPRVFAEPEKDKKNKEKKNQETYVKKEANILKIHTKQYL